MPLATEIAYLLLKEGANPEETGSLADSVLKKTFTTLRNQPGWVRQYWGIQVENPKILVMSIDWEDVQNHKDFINSEAYVPFTTELAQIFDFAAMPPFIYHVNFTSDSVAAREAPVTEFAPFNVALNTSDADKSSFEDSVLALTEHLKNDDKTTGYALGWVLEELENPNAPEGKAKVLMGLLGWPTVEDHMAARETTKFKELIAPIRSTIMPPAAGRGMFHAKLHSS